jgi:Ca2+-binding RTX toxin-like protein
MSAVDGSNAVRLTFNPWIPADPVGFSGFDLNPHWSPQGDRIVFHSGRGLEFGTGQWDVFTINSATGENPTGGQPARRLTRRDANDERCGWSVLTHRLSVTKAGYAAGTVTSSVNGIDCGYDCDALFKHNAQVTLTATPNSEFTFLGFSGGGCSGTSRTCTVTMDQARSVTATFGISAYTLPNTRYTGPNPNVILAPITQFADCPSSTANLIRGTIGSESIIGTARADRIFAGPGNDTVDGLAGNDCLDLGPGTDRGQGGDGNDLLEGGLGEDRVTGNDGNDRLRGGASADRLIGGLGNDTLHGQSGNDRANGERGRDRINGGSSNDVISAGSSNDRAAGDQGNDRVSGNSGNDTLFGNSGRDRMNGGSGADRISGGSGNDRVSARDSRRDRINCGSGRDSVVADRIDVVSRNCERVRRR